MPSSPAFAERLRDEIAALPSADIVVGVPSFGNASTIGGVIDAIRHGIRASFPDATAVVVNADGGSEDGTRDVARQRDDPSLRVVSGIYDGPSGKGSAIRAVFGAVERTGARAGAVLDSDLRSATPEWVARLVGPVLDGRAGFVAPLYARHKHDGTITNTVVYPLVRALYSARVRQPIGGEFGFSGELAEHWLAQDVWATDVARFGIDIFMTTTALARGERVVQTALGTKVHDPKDPAAHLGPMFGQVVGSCFRQMARYPDAWREQRPSREVPVEGELTSADPKPVAVDVARLDAKYDDADADAREVWARVLCADDLALFDASACERAPANAGLERAWARLVYDVAAASQRESNDTDAYVRALLPLYFARVAAHVRAADELSSAEAESLVESQAVAFEAEKPHLLERAE